jgi:hypothetical protein
VGHADEQRIGLRGTTRRVWGRRGVKVRQRLQLRYERDLLDALVRLFEEVRRRVEGTVYATLADKVAAVQAFLEELDADPARVRQLCGWDWLTDALPIPEEKAA